MNRYARAAAAALFVAWSGFAYADSEYAAKLSMVDGLPGLRTGVPDLDAGSTINGHWTTHSDPRASGFTRDRDGTGPQAPWLEWRGNSDLHRGGGSPQTMGEALGRSVAAGGNASASSSVSMFGLQSSGTTTVVGDSEIAAAATWSRGFSLGAFESFTFTALSTLSIAGDDAPLDVLNSFTYNPSGSFASLAVTDALGRVGVSLWAMLGNFVTDTWSDFYSYSIGPGGLLSLTITNNTASALTGTLGAGAYVDVSTPIPEPGTWALMLLGAVVVAHSARRMNARR